jgi:hypothetical protein
MEEKKNEASQKKTPHDERKIQIRIKVILYNIV